MCFQVVLAYEVIVLCKCSGNVPIGYGKFSPSQKVHFLLHYSHTHGGERKCTRAKHHGRLKPKWSSLDDYLNFFYWYPRIAPFTQGSNILFLAAA